MLTGFVFFVAACPLVCFSQKKLPKKYQYMKQKTSEELVELIENGTWDKKGAAAFVFAYRNDVGMDKKVEILTGALQKEILKSYSNRVPYPELCLEEECVRMQFQNALAVLGKPAANSLKNKVKGSDLLSSAYKQRIVIVLGFIGDKSVMKDLLTLITQAENKNVWAEAIQALVTCCPEKAKKDEKIISIFLKSLNDSYSYKVVGLPDMGHRYFPVYQAAWSALLELGFTVKDIETHK